MKSLKKAYTWTQGVLHMGGPEFVFSSSKITIWNNLYNIHENLQNDVAKLQL